MGFFKTITEGGQIWAHRIRMARQVLKMGICVSLILGSGFFSYRLISISQFHYQALFYYWQAKHLSAPEMVITVDAKFWEKLTQTTGLETPLSLKAATIKKGCGRHALLTLNFIHQSFSQALKVSFWGLGITFLFFLIRGWRARQKEHIEGQQIVSPYKMAFKLQLKGKASPIKLGRLPLIKNSETHHFLISGATGTGKTTTFHTLLPQIRKLGQKALIVDVTGEFVERYYRPGQDVLLNPFDSRSQPWHPWCEGVSPNDLKSLAQSFIPSSYREEENFWRKGAQEVFYAALKETAFHTKTSFLSKLILHDSLGTLATVLQGTAATPYLDLASEKTAGSVRAVASSFLECLDLIPDTESPFSIRRWVEDPKMEGWLFLTCTPEQRASLIPLLTAWLSIGISSLLRLKINPQRRVWFVIDELPRLHRIKNLEAFLTESRKYGGCGLLAIQSPAQLDAIYGKEITSVILGNCATKMAFAEYDALIAERISRGFGRREIKESQEALSYGAHEMRDGVNLSYQTKSSPIVSASALQSLNPHEAFVKLPGNQPITKLRI